MIMIGLFNHFASSCATQFLGFKSWNYYLNYDPVTCEILKFPILGSHSGLILILLAVVDDLFRAVGLLAIIFIMFTGFKYILSQGKPDETSKALSSGINALVGLGISMVAITFVGFLGSKLDSNNQNPGQVGLLDLRSLPNPFGSDNGQIIPTAMSIAFGLLGAISFLIIVIAGMNYAFSQGDPQTTAKAKNAIIYAIVGLVVAILAQSIVSFAVNTRP